jgi:hypothetical protein
MPFPRIDACLVCELARPEAMGKFSVLGYYGIAPYVHIQVHNFGIALSLTFLFAGGPGSGHFRIGLRITAPNGATFDAPGVEGDILAQANLTNIFMGFQGVLPGPGDYTATLLANDAQQFQTRFTLEPMASTPVPGRGIPPPPPIRPN